MPDMLKLPMAFGKSLDSMNNSVQNSKKKVREAKTHLAMSLQTISENNQKLIRLEYKTNVLKTIESLNDTLYILTQKIDAGIFYEALQIYKKAMDKLMGMDDAIRQTSVVQRAVELLAGKKGEIRQLCVYFLIDQIFNTGVLNPAEELLNQIDFGKIVFDVIEEKDPSDRQKNQPIIDLVPEESSNTMPKGKLFGRRRVRFIFSIVQNMDGLTPKDFLSYIDLGKMDQILDVMFDKEIVKVFQELTNTNAQLNQADDQINYFNIFLSVRCLKDLDPECTIPELLVTNLDENFNRIILNCFNAFLKEVYILEMNTAKLGCPKLPYFIWESEYSKTLLPASYLLSNIPNLEIVCKHLVLVIFYSLQYLADFVKLCQFLSDEQSLKANLGSLVLCLSKKISMVMEKLLLNMTKVREDEAMLLVSEDFNAKCYEIEKRLQLTHSYFPFCMQLVMRMLNKGLNSLGENLDPVHQAEFAREAGGCMTNFCESLYKRYFHLMKNANLFEGLIKIPRNLEVFHFRQADKDKLTQDGVDQNEMRPYLPAAEYVKVILDDISLQFSLMKFEHHQKFMLAYYNYSLYGFIQLLVDKFKDDINDYNMKSLKQALGFKELLTSDYSFHQFMQYLGLHGFGDTIGNFIAEDEYFKALALNYSRLSSQLSILPIQAFKEDKYVSIGENCSIVFDCFVSVKLSFIRNFESILSCVEEGVLRRLINENLSGDNRVSNQIEREKAQQILINNFLTEMKKPKSEVSRKSEEIYKNQKHTGQIFEEFGMTSIDSQILMLFYYYSKFDKMLIELYLSLKIIIHLTILIYLNPRFQPTAQDQTEKVIVNGNLMVTFFKKYKLLVEALAPNISPVLTGFLFDESIHLIATQLEENLYELMKYSPKSVPTLIPLLTNLQENLASLKVYEFDTESLKRIGKRLKRFLQLFEKAPNEELLLKILKDNPGRYTKKQIVNFVLAMNHNTPRDETELPFNLTNIIKKGEEFLKQ